MSYVVGHGIWMPHKITFRVDDNLYNEIVGHSMATSDLIRKSVRQFLNPKIENVGHVVGQMGDEISDDIYSEIYNEFYNLELHPLNIEKRYLKNENKDLRERIVYFKNNELYFKQQINALMIAKIPLLARLKMWLLRREILLQDKN